VCPGYTDTALLERVAARISERSGRDSSTIKAGFAGTNPAKRLVTPSEVADTVAWLCGPHASALNGQAIAVANGEVLH
jgi:NAD(P)-dependent dehydrogenase (short-subunit alcohol dehydrogenase family)